MWVSWVLWDDHYERMPKRNFQFGCFDVFLCFECIIIIFIIVKTFGIPTENTFEFFEPELCVHNVMCILLFFSYYVIWFHTNVISVALIAKKNQFKNRFYPLLCNISLYFIKKYSANINSVQTSQMYGCLMLFNCIKELSVPRGCKYLVDLTRQPLNVLNLYFLHRNCFS